MFSVCPRRWALAALSLLLWVLREEDPLGSIGSLCWGGELARDTPPCVDPTVRLVPSTSGPLGNLGARGKARE